MNDKIEGSLGILGAMVVLFTTMLDPRISLGLSVTLLLLIGIYHLVRTSARAPLNLGTPPRSEPDASDASGANQLR